MSWCSQPIASHRLWIDFSRTKTFRISIDIGHSLAAWSLSAISIYLPESLKTNGMLENEHALDFWWLSTCYICYFAKSRNLFSEYENTIMSSRWRGRNSQVASLFQVTASDSWTRASTLSTPFYFSCPKRISFDVLSLHEAWHECDATRYAPR